VSNTKATVKRAIRNRDSQILANAARRERHGGGDKFLANLLDRAARDEKGEGK
jgi:hypothetical protein